MFCHEKEKESLSLIKETFGRYRDGKKDAADVLLPEALLQCDVLVDTIYRLRTELEVRQEIEDLSKLKEENRQLKEELEKVRDWFNKYGNHGTF